MDPVELPGRRDWVDLGFGMPRGILQSWFLKPGQGCSCPFCVIAALGVLARPG